MNEGDTRLADERKSRASTWFAELQGTICGAFEALEDSLADGPRSDAAPGRFVRTQTKRTGAEGEDAGGGVMAVMKGRVFEKVGVNVSTVHGRLGEEAQRALTARKEIPGLAENPVFWASGVSLVAHMWNPRVPAVHMNTRHFWTPGASWFGGGTDLNPTMPLDHLGTQEDAASFHGELKSACDRHDPDYYPRFKAWADDYFMIRHWDEPRGVGGIFYDDLDSGHWDADFAFTQSVGRAFLDAYRPIVERRMHEAYSDDDVSFQLFRRGRYAEFNLVYDRGTKFGLTTGHNPAAVLMSLPPRAEWP